jgi:hypothetical protein
MMPTISALLIGTVWLIEVIRVFTPAPTLAAIGLACLGVYAALALARASRHIAILFLLVIGAAVGIAAWQHGFPTLLAGFAKAQIFGAFLPSVLLLRATAEASPRIQRVREDLGGLDANGARSWTQYGSHLLGAVLNVGAVAILAPVVARGADTATRLELARSAARGVGGAVMWSPFFVSIAFISQLVPGVAMWQTMLVGTGLAILGFILSHALFTPGMRARDLRLSLARLGPILGPMSIVIGAVVAASLALRWSGLQAVAIVVPAMCVAYIAFLGPAKAGGIARRTVASFARLSDELLIVVGATILGAVVASLPAVQQLGAEVTPEMVAGPLLIAALVLVLLVLGQLGLHPMIGASIVIPVVAAGDFGVCRVALVNAGVFAWALNASVSMWTLPVAVAASAFEVPAARMFSRRTFAYLVLHAAGGLLYLAAANATLRALGCT